MKTVRDKFVENLLARLNGQGRLIFGDADVDGVDGSARVGSGGGRNSGSESTCGENLRSMSELVKITPARVRAAGVDVDKIFAASAEAVGIDRCAKIPAMGVCGEFLRKIPIAFARRFRIIGLTDSASDTTILAMADPTDSTTIMSVERMLGKPVEPVIADEKLITDAINLAYRDSTGTAELEDITQINDAEISANSRVEDLLDHEGRAPVVKLINMILLEAVKMGCSDVHVQPFEDRLAVRFRLDGVLRDMYWPSLSLHGEMISRIKVMGAMDIAERRLAQDGRTSVEVGGRVVDLRISTLPTSFGERAVIRLLDKSLRLYTLPELGMPENILKNFRRFVHMDHGIILVTGPTGSGKSTTLYAALGEINSREKNILTLEDPIEYRLEGISQTQVATRKGMTFASGLRHVLRQDPDIIMVGEIRDAETARMAIQSALTGHLVFSTLHTNDAAGAVARMLDLGVEPYLLAGSLLCSLAQRLVRKTCEVCGGTGCERCLNTGYKGRLGIFELLSVDDSLRRLILKQSGAAEIRNAARAAGMTTLRCDGLAKAERGLTTIEDVDRVAAAADSADETKKESGS